MGREPGRLDVRECFEALVPGALATLADLTAREGDPRASPKQRARGSGCAPPATTLSGCVGPQIGLSAGRILRSLHEGITRFDARARGHAHAADRERLTTIATLNA